MATAHAPLPTEVCERIVDFVADRGDAADELWLAEVFATLQACSLTCRALLLRCRFHLFRVVGVGKQDKSLDAFIVFLNENRALHEFVDTFVMHGSETSNQLRLLPLKIPGLLPNAKDLYIGAETLYPPPIFFASMRQFIQVERLTLFKVSFYSIHDLRRTICAFSNLSQLVLSYLKWIPGQTGPAHASSLGGKLRLSMLAIDGDAEWISDPRSGLFLEWLSQTNMITTLDSVYLLHCRITAENALHTVQNILQACKSSLRFLSLGFDTDIPFEQLSHTFTELNKLLLLSIKLPHCTKSFDNLIDIIHTYSLDKEATPSLRNLVVLLDHRADTKPVATDQWAKLDIALQAPRFQSLSKFMPKHIKEQSLDGKPVIRKDGHPELEPFSTDDAEAWRNEVKGFLPLTATRKRKVLCYEPAMEAPPTPV